MGDTKRIVSASVIAGLFEAVVACPFERGQSLLQTPEFHGKIKNTWDLRYRCPRYYQISLNSILTSIAIRQSKISIT